MGLAARFLTWGWNVTVKKIQFSSSWIICIYYCSGAALSIKF
jgi:hypothetical protein